MDSNQRGMVSSPGAGGFNQALKARKELFPRTKGFLEHRNGLGRRVEKCLATWGQGG